MYIDHLRLNAFRSFQEASTDFVHPDRDFAGMGMPRPKLPNVNLLLGENGTGKTTLLKAVALTALGPGVADSGIAPQHLVRREAVAPADAGRKRSAAPELAEAGLHADFVLHPQDGSGERLASQVRVMRSGGQETLAWAGPRAIDWKPARAVGPAGVFCVGYGSTRRVEPSEQATPGTRRRGGVPQAQQVQSLFAEEHALPPLNSWLPRFKRDKVLYQQVVDLIDKLSYQVRFSGEMENGDYLFARGGLKLPFTALSDGYRAYLGWIGDMLYHACMAAPKGADLRETRGIVLVDHIDQHLHPKWQMTVLHTLAKALPNVQFIVSAHSPLLVGALEWMNILVLRVDAQRSSTVVRLPSPVHGLDADQVLLSDYFGMASTRTSAVQRELKSLGVKAGMGDADSALALLERMSRGAEEAAK